MSSIILSACCYSRVFFLLTNTHNRGFFVILPRAFLSVQGKLFAGLEGDLSVFEDDELGISMKQRGEGEGKLIKRLKWVRNNVRTCFASRLFV